MTRRYQIRPARPLAVEIPRIMSNRIQLATDALTLAFDDQETGIHDARKLFKEIRSLLRLLRPHLDPAVYQAESQRYRNAGARLSGKRDAQVMLNTWQELVTRYPLQLNSARDPVTRELEHNFAREHGGADALPATLMMLRMDLHAHEEAPLGWRFPCRDFDLVRPGFKRTYGRACDAWQQAETSETSFHEWRKRSKDLLYQLRLMTPVWDGDLKAYDRGLKQMTEYQGLANDVVVLRAALQGNPQLFASRADASACAKVLQKEHKRLCRKADKSAVVLFRDNRKRFIRQLESCWRHSRQKSTA